MADKTTTLNESMIDEAKEDIQYEWDGPVTNYVAVMRAMRLARNHKSFSISDIAEALLDTLDVPAE